MEFRMWRTGLDVLPWSFRAFDYVYRVPEFAGAWLRFKQIRHHRASALADRAVVASRPGRGAGVFQARCRDIKKRALIQNG
jgi:hypothetical protein